MDPHPVIVTKKDNRDYIKVLFYSYYTTVTRWAVLLRSRHIEYALNHLRNPDIV